MRVNGNRHGFTLIEILIVLAIVFILLGLLLPALYSGPEKFRRALARQSIREIGIALDQYRHDFDYYPMPETKFGNPGSDPVAGSKALAYFLCTRFKVGDRFVGPYLNWPTSGFDNSTPSEPSLVSPLKNKYLYSNIWDKDGVMRGYLVVDPGPDHIFGGSIQTGSSTQPTPIPAWLPDGSGNDADNIEKPN